MAAKGETKWLYVDDIRLFLFNKKNEEWEGKAKEMQEIRTD